MSSGNTSHLGSATRAPVTGYTSQHELIARILIAFTSVHTTTFTITYLAAATAGDAPVSLMTPRTVRKSVRKSVNSDTAVTGAGVEACGSQSVIGHDRHQSRVGHARLMTFSWWIWSALVLVGLVGAGLLVRATVVTIREYGFGRGRLTSRPGAPWFWAGVATLFAAGVLTIGWAYMLDG